MVSVDLEPALMVAGALIATASVLFNEFSVRPSRHRTIHSNKRAHPLVGRAGKPISTPGECPPRQDNVLAIVNYANFLPLFFRAGWKSRAERVATGLESRL